MASSELTQFPLEEEYKKDTGITPADIADLRRWLETQPHLPAKYITDLDLILAFHSCGCSTDVTKQVLDLHYTLRTLFSPYFKDRCFDNRAKKSLEIVNIFMVLDVWQYKEGTWPGFVFIVDFEGFSLGHVTRMDLQTLQQFLYYLQEAMLVKLKGFHFINAPSFIDKVLMLIKPFMKKELMDMFGIHMPGAATLQSVLPMEALPKDSGGKYKTQQECKDDVIAMLTAAESYLKNENLKRVTESLRPGKPKTISDIFGGVEGSFKKLDID